MTTSSKLTIISGPPRSGTTLVNRILCASPKCAPVLPECSFITNQIEQYANILLYADKERFSNYFQTQEECRVCFKKCIEAHLESLRKARQDLVGYEHLVLKDPMLSYFLVQAQELLPPDTRFVIMVRNPLAVIASLKKVATKNGVEWNFKAKVDEIFNFYFHLNGFHQKANNTATHFVRYEDLVSGKWEALESFLGFPVVDQFIPGKFKGGFDKADPFYSPLYEKSVSSKRINSWQDELSSSEISYVNEAFSGIMLYWQYV